MNSFENRLARALKLESGLFAEVENDGNAGRQAALVVALSSLSAGVAMSEEGLSTLWVLSANIVSSFLGWLLWAWIIYIAGTKMFPGPQTKSNLGELLRVLGFASAPGVIRCVGIVPGFGLPVFVIASVWTIAATVIAVKEALDFQGTGRAVIVCLTGWLIQTLFIWSVVIILNWIAMPVTA